MKRQFMHTQPPQGNGAAGYPQANAAASQPENVSMSPKKNGSGLLSGYNANMNNAQRPPQPVFQSTPAGSIGQLPHPTQVPKTEVRKQHPSSGSPGSRAGNSPSASHAPAPVSQRPAQQPPSSFAPSNAPQRPAQQQYQEMPPQTRSAPNFQKQRQYAGTPATTGVSNNPNNRGLAAPPVPAKPNTYPNTGTLAFTNAPSQVSPPRVPNYPAGPPPYPGFPPMQQMSGMRPPYAPYGPPTSFKSTRRRRLPLWASLAMGFAAFLLLVSGGVFAYYEVAIAPSLNSIIGHEAIHHSTSGSKTTNQGPTVNAQNSALSSQKRINILLLGSDTDGKNGAPLAQSDIVVTIDQQTHYVGMLSIPRDLQVSIPNNGEGKMDFAFSYGWQAQRSHDTTADAEAGAGLAEDTIQQNFGIHIDRYAWVGLTGFVKVIDTAGGVNVDVTHPMVDDDYPDDVSNANGSVYDYRRLYIAPGPQHLNGTEALDYVRTRHSDLIGDFGRSARQQQVLSALKSKLETPDTISQTPQLLKDLNGYLLTDMQLDDLAFLGNLSRSIDLNSVQHVTLSPPYSTPSGQNTNYLPVCSQITPIISQMFGIQGNCIPQYGGSAAMNSVAPPSSQSNIQTGTPTSQGGTQHAQQSTSQKPQVPSPNFNSMDIVGGVHALLDVMLMTVFESFDAVKL